MRTVRGLVELVRRGWGSRPLPAALIAAGACLVVTGAYMAYVFTHVPAVVLEHSRDNPAEAALANLANRLQQISPYAQRHQAPPRPAQPRTGLWIEIPSVGISLPVDQGDGSDHIPYWEALVYPGTAEPGDAGNSYVYAHGIWGMFGGLLFLQKGDHVYLHDYSNRTKRDFVVSRVVGDVRYNDVRWLKQTSSTPLLTLQTCVGWDLKGDRYVVQAVPARGGS